MKVDQLAMSIERLRMVKNRSKRQVSINYKNYDLKILWRDLSEEAEMLLEIYSVVDIKNNDLIMKLYDKECQLYFKMKVLLDKDNFVLDELKERFKVIDTIKMSKIRKDI